jgi:hypothetical protein
MPLAASIAHQAGIDNPVVRAGRQDFTKTLTVLPATSGKSRRQPGTGAPDLQNVAIIEWTF